MPDSEPHEALVAFRLSDRAWRARRLVDRKPMTLLGGG